MCDGPLHIAKITGAICRELSIEPGLLLQPGHGCQAIVVFTDKRVKVPTRAESATSALNHHLIATFSKQIAVVKSEESASPIAGADQDRRQSACTTWDIAVCQ